MGTISKENEMTTVLVIRRVDGSHEVRPMEREAAFDEARRLGFDGGIDVYDKTPTDPSVRHVWVTNSRDPEAFEQSLNKR